MTRSRSFVFVFVLCLLLVSCQPRQQATQGPRSKTGSGAAQSESAAPFRDLAQDESEGGHTLKRHVGLNDSELRQRLEREPDISAASTYTDRGTAERVVGASLAGNRSRVERWLARKGRHTNLVLDYDSDQPVGRTLHRGEQHATACSHALVVLKSDEPGRFHVLTSYPECR